jgi:hypothetical protein
MVEPVDAGEGDGQGAAAEDAADDDVPQDTQGTGFPDTRVPDGV